MIVTRDQLVAGDHDQLYDLYDARFHGGFPEVTSPQCTGTGCQGVPNAPPESTRYTHGNRFCIATSCARRCFLTVIG